MTILSFKSKGTRQKTSNRKGRQATTAVFALILTIVAYQGTVSAALTGGGADLSSLHLVPYPRHIKPAGEAFTFSGDSLTIVTGTGCTANDESTAEIFREDLQSEWGINAQVRKEKRARSIVLERTASPDIPEQGYQIEVSPTEVVIRSNNDAGLFYATRTILQLILPATEETYSIPGVTISDWPDILKRAVHYDTKHHQDKFSYVKSFIRDLSRYKINQLIWEWEDKFAYESHPEIGAPGAFSATEIKELTQYGQKYHIEIIPLVQGLGHVSYILKWPQHKHLREVPASNWEFCPLKEGSYELLFSLWDEAIDATPGTSYIHIGSDEAYELALCEKCRAEAEKIGKSGVYLTFVNRAAKYLAAKGRKAIIWEKPLGWQNSASPAVGIEPDKNLVFTDSYGKDNLNWNAIAKVKDSGYELFGFDPNPGVEHLFLPYHFREREGRRVEGSMEYSYKYVSAAALSGQFTGMIDPSWDDAGLHNQMWMLSFATMAAYAWNGSGSLPDEFENSFFADYYGRQVTDMKELYTLLNEGSYFYSHSFERNVWHHSGNGKMHLPDLPRLNNVEYDPFWNTEYKAKVEEAEEMLSKMNRALQIIENNKAAGAKHAYDFEIYRTVAELIKHTCLVHLDLSNLEYAVAKAHNLIYQDRRKSIDELIRATTIIKNSLARRDTVFNDLVRTWEETRLPKGMSLPGKEYFWQQDRARHFANRQADMSYLIFDEQMLYMEGYLEKLHAYIDYLIKSGD